MKYWLILSLALTFASCDDSNKTINSSETETINGYRYEKGSDKAFTGTVMFKNGTSKQFRDGKATSTTFYHDNGKPSSIKYKDENGHYYKREDFDKAGNKINEKTYK